MLIGKQVPSMSGKGMETLRDTNDAREWQDAVREVLTQEIEARTTTWVQDSYGFMETVHSSIDLFKNNPDLIPGTKGFDKRLADDFANMMKPYEVRLEGRLHGYSIPVQPIIDTLRTQLKAQQKPGKAAQAAKAPVDAPPQRGISSRAATSSEPEDFSTLFGTIGLPQLRI